MGFWGFGVSGFGVASHGLSDPESLAKVRARGGYYNSLVPQVPARYRRLMDGQLLHIGGRAWRCIAGYGHAPERLALHCADAPWATPTASGSGLLRSRRHGAAARFHQRQRHRPGARGRPADAVPRLPATRCASPAPDTLVLPSHGKPFVGLHARIAQAASPHHARPFCRCAGGLRASALLRRRPAARAVRTPRWTCTRPPSPMGEAVARLHALVNMGRLVAVSAARGGRGGGGWGEPGPVSAFRIWRQSRVDPRPAATAQPVGRCAGPFSCAVRDDSDALKCARVVTGTRHPPNGGTGGLAPP